MNVCRRHEDRTAVRAGAILDVLRLQGADDDCGVLLRESAIKELVIGLTGPDSRGDEPTQHQKSREEDRGFLTDGELAPHPQKGIKKRFHLVELRGKLYGHAHELLEALDDLIADLNHEAECHRSFLHRDHTLVERSTLAKEHRFS